MNIFQALKLTWTCPAMSLQWWPPGWVLGSTEPQMCGRWWWTNHCPNRWNTWSTTPAPLWHTETRKKNTARDEWHVLRRKDREILIYVEEQVKQSKKFTLFHVCACVWSHLSCHSRRIAHRTHSPQWKIYWQDIPSNLATTIKNTAQLKYFLITCILTN